MNKNSFFYNLPEELIAKEPSKKRDKSKMMVLQNQETEIKTFQDITSYLNEDDVLVLNNTKVIAARLFGHKESGAKIEVLLIKQIKNSIWQVLIKPAKRVKEQQIIIFSNNEYCTLLHKNIDNTCDVEFSCADVYKLAEEVGNIPLPPYIKRKANDNDKTRYQSVFASQEGSIAAPTASLHFTEEILQQLKNKGVKITFITLHVGLGTFLPVSCQNIQDHKMHHESFSLGQETVDIIKEAKKNHKKILAVGTTVVRVLESCYDEETFLISKSGETDIFLYPPYKSKVANCLLTNFHLPESTLLMLVSTFISRELLFECYTKAIKEKMRFYSYGDCMLILS